MIKQLLSIGILTAATMTSQAVVLADWDFSTSSGTIPDADITPGTTLIASALSGTTSGITSTDLISGGSLRYENAGGAAGELNLKNFHITTGDGRGFFTFTLTADAGKTINVDSLTMSSYRNGTGAPVELDWHVSVDGGTETLYGGSQDGQLTPFATDTFTESITGASTVKFTFRLDNTAKNGNIHFNDIQVNGTVVPEPSSAALLGLGGIALLLRRRK